MFMCFYFHNLDFVVLLVSIGRGLQVKMYVFRGFCQILLLLPL